MSSKPITSLDPVDTLMKEVQEMQVNLITRPYIGSVCNSMESDKSEHSHSEHFFYIWTIEYIVNVCVCFVKEEKF